MNKPPFPSDSRTGLWSHPETTPRPPQDQPEARGTAGGPRPLRRGSLPALLAVSALLGGGVSTGLLTATGAIATEAPAATATAPDTRPVNAITATSDGDLDAKALYARTSAGVVDITAEGASDDRAASSPFGGPSGQPSRATGTGFVIDEAGHIVTAAHVVEGGSSISVTFEDGSTREARLLGQDDSTDIALLKVDASGLELQPLRLGSSESVEVGDEVAAIGDPFGYERSISTGIVSGLDRSISAPNGFSVAHAIQTDAAVNPGNSGGPLLNAAGEVIGVVDQIATDGAGRQSSGVGFAVPIELVTSALEALKAGKAVEHAYLGVAAAEAGGAATGATLGEVAAGGPADEAGLRAGDVVTELAGKPIRNAGDLIAAVADHQPGDEASITVRRGSDTLERSVTLGKQPARRG